MKFDFYQFQVFHFLSATVEWATPESRFNCFQKHRINHQVKYWRLKVNTCIVAAILFSAHPYMCRRFSSDHLSPKWCNVVPFALVLGRFFAAEPKVDPRDKCVIIVVQVLSCYSKHSKSATMH